MPKIKVRIIAISFAIKFSNKVKNSIIQPIVNKKGTNLKSRILTPKIFTNGASIIDTPG